MKYTILLAAVLLGAGCVSLTNFQSPQALPPGSSSVGGGLSLHNVHWWSYPMPEADFLLRYGLSDGIDVGSKVALPFLSATADVKWQFLRGPFAAAFDVGGSYSYAPRMIDMSSEVNVFGVYPELIVGSERIYGAARMLRVHAGEFVTPLTAWHPQVFVGGSFGDQFRVTPELSLTIGLWDPADRSPVLGLGVAFTYCPQAESDDASPFGW
jgi:hypothetical protein